MLSAASWIFGVCDRRGANHDLDLAYMNIISIGSTRRVGPFTMGYALAQGYLVTAFVRNKTKVKIAYAYTNLSITRIYHAIT